MKKIKFNTDRVLGISAMVISLLTLIIFIHQTNIMREQSKLSVKPRLDFTLNQGGNDSIIQFQEVIENKGLGPAIIDSIYFIYEGKHYDLQPENFLNQVAPKVFEYGHLPQHASLGRGSTLMPGEEHPVLTYRIKMENLNSLLEYLGTSLDGDSPFPIEVIYTSIYEDEHWIVHSDKGEPFKVD